MKAGARASVGACLAGMQFGLAACWAVQAVYLPVLVARAGWPGSAAVWLAAAEQAILVVSDYATGMAADHLAARRGQIGKAVLGVTLVSCGAFMLLPAVAARGSGSALLVLLALWTATSSALRVTPLQLVGRRTAAASWPALIGMSMLGLGAASALAPTVAVGLRSVEPQGPFALAGLALVLATFGIVAAERLLREEGADAGAARHGSEVGAAAPADPASVPGRRTERRGMVVMTTAAALSAGVAFQTHVFVNSEPLYRRLAAPADLAYLTPVFWVGFSLFLLPAARLIRRAGPWPVMAGGALAGGVISLLMPWVRALPLLVDLQFFAGCAWACTLLGAASATLALSRRGQEGRFAGALGALSALAALVRLALQAEDSNPLRGAWLEGLSAAGWFGAALMLRLAERRRPTGR